MDDLHQVEKRETLRQKHLIYCEKLVSLRMQRDGNEEALGAMGDLSPESEVWIKTRSGFHLKLSVENGIKLIRKDQQRISEEMQITNDNKQQIAILLQDFDLTPESFINKLKAAENRV